MSVPAEKGEPPPEGETVCCHHALYKKEVGLIMGILGNFVSTRDTDPFSDRDRASELQVVLEEMEMIRQYCDTSTQFVLSENAINVNGALGLLCEFLYRIARDVTHKVYSYFSKSVRLIASFLENCVRVNQRVREKLLNSGLLIGQIALLEIWGPLQDEKDLSPNLILSLSVLHQCFMTSSMSLFYAFIDKDWCQILKPLTSSTNQEIRMLSKIVASDIYFALSNEEQCITELTDEDTDFLVCHLAMATASDQRESSIDGFHKPISVMELLLALENFAKNSKNCSKVLEQPIIISTLSALLLSSESRQQTAVCRLLILLVGSASFDSVWSEDDKMLLVDSLGELKGSEDVALQSLSLSLLCLLQKEGYQAFTSLLLEAVLKLNKTLSEKIELDPIKGSSSCEPSTIHDFNNLLKIMIVLAEEYECNEDFLSALSNSNITGTLQALYRFIAITFNSIESLDDSVFPCLPLILMLLLRWSAKCKEARCWIMKEGRLNQHINQLRILATHENTWFTNFLIQLNLGIILNCVQENQFLVFYQEVCWSALFTQWLKSSQEDTRIATFLTGSFVLRHIEEEDPAMLVLRKEDSEKCITLFATAVESPQLSAVLCHNLFVVSVQLLLEAFKNVFVTHSHFFKSQRVFNAVVTLMLNGGVPEIRAACEFVVTMEDWPFLNDMVNNCELPLLEILEQLEKSEDCELKTSAQNALNIVQGYSTQDLSSTDVCKGLMSDALKTVQNISRNFQMAEDSHWELLDKCITQYLSIYLKSDSKTKSVMVDDISATRSVVRTLCRFVSMLIEYITISRNTKRIQLQCLGVIVSGLSSWSDWSRKIRCQIQHTQVIIHLINLVSFLSSISDEEASISQLVLTSAIIISNCSSEKDFGLLYAPPGKIDWATILATWMESSYAPLRFSAKSIAGNIIHVLDNDVLFLLELTNTEIELLAEMVSQCVFSESLRAGGFGCQFHAKELIDIVSNLAVSPHNFSEIVQSKSLPLSLLQLLRKGESYEKKSTCRLLLQLACCSYNFSKEMNDLQLKEVLFEEMSEESNDPCFLFLGQCLLLALDNAGAESTRSSICYNFGDMNALVDIFMKIVDVLVTEIATLLVKFEGIKICLSTNNSFHMRVMELIEEIYLFWSKCSLPIQEAVSNALASNHSQTLQVLHRFLLKAVRALGNNTDDLIGPCLVKILLCLQGWTQTSSHLCERILDEGLFLNYVTTRFSSMKNNNFENFIVSTVMNIIFHCVQLPTISVYYTAITSSKLLHTFATSPLLELRVITKCIAGYVSPSLDDQMVSVVHFSEEDAEALVNIFCRAAHSDSHLAKFDGGFYSLHLLPIMKAINHLLIQRTEMNTLKQQLVKLVDILDVNFQSFFQSLVAVVKHGTVSEMTIACGLIWSLLDVENIGIKVQTKSETVCQEMVQLSQKHCNAPQLEHLCHCITLMLKDTWLNDVKKSEAVVRGLYLQGRMTQCVDVCSKAIQLQSGSDDSIRTLEILQGKALYHKYIQEQRRLQLSPLTVDMKLVLKEACYKINMQVIELLGKAFDDGLLVDDDEATHMLDRAMMDCIFKANMLGSCQRCYLCRRNLKKTVNTTPELRQTEEAGKEQEENTSVLSLSTAQRGSRGKKVDKLIKSHIIPRAILEQLCGTLSSNKQVILATQSSLRAAEDRLLTPAELAYYMLCPKCEDILSANGETQFSLKFFRKLYSLTDERWAEAEQEIEYGPWLYQFCVGLIFRALHWDVDDYSNSKELYAVFSKCRAVIMEWMQTDKRESIGNLKISLFISPLSVAHYEEQFGYINMYLRGGIGEFFGHKDDSFASKLQAHFFAVRFGVVNIAVGFGEFTFEDDFNMFIISPTGGTYHVPSERERRRQIPQCIWSQFQDLSITLRSKLWVADPQISRSMKGEQEKPDKANPFNVGAGIISEGLSNFLKHLSISHDATRDICVLPPEFSLKSTTNSGKITLPKGHTVLLHANYVRDQGAGSTFFVAIGSSKKYPINKPYVIWHFYDHQGQSSCGAFFSTNDLSITQFLVSSQTITMQRLANTVLVTARERMPKILSDLLAEKGFSSMASLLQHVKSAVCAGRDIPPLDTKCSRDRKCWYCRSLCQNCCQKSVAYGRIASGPYGPNQFCSESCQLLSPGMFSSPQVFLISPTTPPPQGVYIHCDPINQQHREIQHIYTRRLNKKKFPCEIEICLCVGDGTDGCPPNRPYIVFYSHHLFHQLFAEFFVSEELLAEEPLPHTANEASWNSILQLNEAMAVRKILESADVLETTMVQIHQLKSSSEPTDPFQSISEWSTASALHQ